ncbi:hypothetical protein ABZX75_00275 [Streptomyces sp. NPDC003038]|uniref:hypothetical protein n=1 Tax=unclassified Streptomyces TaxID=2593676 RepID=UPI0033A8D2C3
MSTPPNPPSTPHDPPTEPAGTPPPEAASIPAPAQPLSLEKTPAPAPAPEPAPASAEPVEAAPMEAAPADPVEAAAPADPPDTTPAPDPAPVAVTATAPAPGPAPEPAPTPFAPLTPAPPASPSPPGGFAPGAPGAHGGAPGALANPWAQPAAGFPYAAYQQAPPTTNGLAVAALAVAIAGIVIGLTPFFFWAGCLLAMTAVGIGIGAIVRSSQGAPRKVMSIVGTALGVLGMGASVGGFLFTGYVAEKAADRLEQEIDWEQEDLEQLDPGDVPSPSHSPTPSEVPGLTSALPFGETFTYDSGIKVTLSAPKKYKPSGLYAREKWNNAIQITVTITNGTTAPHEVIYAMPNVRDDKGMTAEKVFDYGGGVPKMIEGSILPGESASGVVAFEVPEGTTSITADISAGTLLDDVKYAGPIG